MYWRRAACNGLIRALQCSPSLHFVWALIKIGQGVCNVQCLEESEEYFLSVHERLSTWKHYSEALKTLHYVSSIGSIQQATKQAQEPGCIAVQCGQQALSRMAGTHLAAVPALEPHGSLAFKTVTSCSLPHPQCLQL